jgi:hypothetical protein
MLASLAPSIVLNQGFALSFQDERGDNTGCVIFGSLRAR